MQEENNLPILNAIVRPGNESIIESTRLGHAIESTRLGHAVLDELEALKHIELDAGEEPEADVMRPGIGDGSPVHLVAEKPQENQQLIIESADATAANEVLDHELDHPEFDGSSRQRFATGSAPAAAALRDKLTHLLPASRRLYAA